MSVVYWLRNGVMTSLLLGAMIIWKPAEAKASSFIVIANNSVVDSSLSKKELQSIYLGEKIKWGNRKYIKISILEDTSAYKDFLQSIVAKTPSQFDQHWVRMVTTGRASMPPAFPDSKQVIEYVAGHPDSIGFIAAGKVDGSVKIIAIK